MTTYKKEFSDGYELRVDSSFLEERKYLLANFPNPGDDLLDFIWLKKGKEKASILFSINSDQIAKSLPLAPFGGFFISDKLSSESLEEFLNHVEFYLKEKGIKKIELTQAPKPYEINHDLIAYLLFKNKFEQEQVLSHQFFIGKKKIKKFLKKENSRYQSRAKDAGVIVSNCSINNFNFLQDIRAWNQQRGYHVNLDENRIIQQVSEYPDRYFLISLMQGEVAIGHSLAVKLFPETIYYFLSAINPRVQVKYGGELMLYNLFKLASEEKVEIIDLGSSDLEVSPNHDLIFFKSRFSNDISNKITWVKNL
ncbi:hypothetical protein [Algoriphagus machipongonensis]|uniref:BioF2-like acetyltransferase domain-containing protein n=1 Tax=Algoriphagus machipongonensis TaxID=388413 RepID=A3I375_9BACT|nr:hypothetical protein [Algoriphagus machipongonensis]EAZ79101.1 hypothetical protein ALPR1_17268 [Algoriphagus machipongonensis]